jgi:hypothetical protein
MQLGTTDEVLRRSRTTKSKTVQASKSVTIGVSLGDPSLDGASLDPNSSDFTYVLTPEGKSMPKGSDQIRLELDSFSANSNAGHRSFRLLENIELRLSKEISEQTKYLVYTANTGSRKKSEKAQAKQVEPFRRLSISPTFVMAKAHNRGRTGTIPGGALVVGDLVDLINSRLRSIPYFVKIQDRPKTKDGRSLATLVAEFAEIAMASCLEVKVGNETIYFPGQNRTMGISPAMRAQLELIFIKLSDKAVNQRDKHGAPLLSRSITSKAPYAKHRFAFEDHLFSEVPGSEYLSSKIRYLGPLREREHSPGLALSFRSNNIIPLGVKGEKMAEFLIRQQNEVRKFPTVDGGFETCTLKQAINHWLEHLFRFKEPLSVENKGISGPVAMLGHTRFQHLGTGISQLMPVIVLALSSPPGTTLIFEQPELHLHPAMQQRLADFFVLMARSKRQIVLETQSEYILTRIRRHISDGALNPNDTAVLFASSGSITARKIQSDGNLDQEWPEDFFDFSLDDTIALMDAASRETN